MANDQSLKVNLLGDASSLNQALNKSSAKLDQFGKRATKLGRDLSLRISAPLALLGGQSLKTAAKFEKLQTSLNVLTGSAEDGARAFERLKKFSAETPFQLEDLAQANNTLIGFGLSADDAFKSLSMIGDIAAISGGDMKGITVAFGQAAAAGRLMGQDLLQLVNNGVPAIKLLAESMGVAENQVKDLVSEGAVTFEVLMKAFEDATSAGGMFEGGMKKLSGTLGGVFSTLQDNVSLAFAEFGKAIVESFNLVDVTQKLTTGLNNLVQGFTQLSPYTKKFIITLAGITAAIPLVILGIGGMSTALAALSANPIVLIGAAIAALAAAIVSYWRPIANFWISMINYMIETVNKSKVLRQAFHLLLATIKVAVFGAKLSFQTFVKVVSLAIDSVKTQFEAFGKILKGALTFDADLIKEGLNQLLNGVKDVGKQIIQTGTENAKLISEKMKQEFSNALENTPIDKLPLLTKAVKESVEEGMKGGTQTTTTTGAAPSFDDLALEELYSDAQEISQNLDDIIGTDKQLNFAIATDQASVENFNKTLKETGEKVLDFTTKTKEGLMDFSQQARGALMAMAEGIGAAFANALTGGTNFFKALGGLILSVIGDLLIQMGMAAVLASNLAKTFAIPIVGAAAGLAAIALGGMLKAFSSKVQSGGFQKFADGGIVSGPTMGLVGEYAGARSNPEVIAPLDKLKNMLPQGGGGNVNVSGEFVVRGQDLVVALERANRNRNKFL
jgi:tape measure domain-containing protein